jgi:hypothetical protein
MLRKGVASTLGVLVLAGLASAQAPRLHWQVGQVLIYKVEQKTHAIETVTDAKAETSTQLNLTKRWEVLAVDASGVATLRLSLLALAMETKPPSGEPLRFDSAAPEQATPALRDQLRQYVGPPLAVMRVDARGTVLEIKESKFGPASRFEAEPPFGGVLPEGAVQVGGQWSRAYSLTLDPPQGTGEKFPSLQTYTCKSVTPTLLTVSVASTLQTPPTTAAERLPLLQFLPQGELVYDLKAGRLQSATLRIDREEKGQQGEDSSYHLSSTWTAVYVGDK